MVRAGGGMCLGVGSCGPLHELINLIFHQCGQICLLHVLISGA
jgi:hypothetical protein